MQLHAIALFLPAPRFLASFLEVGGVQTVLDIQAMPQAKVPPPRRPPSNTGRIGGTVPLLGSEPPAAQQPFFQILSALKVPPTGRAPSMPE